jgi:PAS domain S-box-containing protein
MLIYGIMATRYAVDLAQTNVRQLQVVRLYVYIAWLYVAIFSPLFIFVIKDVWMSVVVFIDAAVLIWVLRSLRFKSPTTHITFALSCIAALTVGSLVVTGGVAQTGLFLAFPYIPFVVFLRPRASAQRWLFGMLFFMVALLVLSLNNRKLSEADKSQKQAIVKSDAILRSIGEGVIVFDAQGGVVATNKVAEKLLGFREEQLKGGKYTDLVKATDEEGASIGAAERPVNRVIATKKAVATNIYYVRKNGATFPAQISVAPIMLDGVLDGAIEVFRDIYREKEIDRSKTEFVSLASHQLRAPLSTVNWYTEMLLAGDAGKINQEQKRFISEIHRSNRRMTELVSSLLNVSRLELGTFSVEPEPTDIVKLAQNTIQDLEPQIFARKLDFREQYDSKMPIINVDPKLMRIVIENLASNAIKYTPETGRVTLSITRSGHITQITVQDTGLGIPAAQQERIFSKLFRADNVKTRETSGTGLGLYLVKSIVDYSGGKIWFKSREGKGTTFFVHIPDSGMKHKQGAKPLD